MTDRTLRNSKYIISSDKVKNYTKTKYYSDKMLFLKLNSGEM